MRTMKGFFGALPPGHRDGLRGRSRLLDVHVPYASPRSPS